MSGNRFAMGQVGTHFVEGPINISWGYGREESDVQRVPPELQSARFKQAVLAGRIVETDRKATDTLTDLPDREYKLLTGKEALDHMNIPAGPVTRKTWDPRKGELVDLELSIPRPTRATAARETAEAETLARQAAEAAGTTPGAPESPSQEDIDRVKAELEAGTDDDGRPLPSGGGETPDNGEPLQPDPDPRPAGPALSGAVLQEGNPGTASFDEAADTGPAESGEGGVLNDPQPATVAPVETTEATPKPEPKPAAKPESKAKSTAKSK